MSDPPPPDPPVFFGIELAGGSDSDVAAPDALVAEAFAILRPKPSPAPLIRLGPGDRDGAYLAPDDLRGLAACFSPGVSNRKDFEDELTTRFGVACHLCDRSSDEGRFATPLIAGRQTFRKLWLDLPGVADSITLHDWVAELAPGSDDLLLQMDIEGAEYRNLLACPAETLRRFRVLILELHDLGAVLRAAPLRQVILPLLGKLDADFVCVHAHPNNCCGEVILPRIGANLPNVLEVTFLRRDRFAAPHAANPVLAPHPLDVSRNVEDVAPMFLNEAWLDGPRPAASRIKMLEDELAFQPRRLARAETAWRRQLAGALAWTVRAARTAGLSPDAPPPPAPLEEVAVGRRFRLSSAWPGYPTEGVVPAAAPRFFFHTAMGEGERITVDLAEPRRVREIAIVNRRDTCFDRAQWLFVVLHEAADPDGAPTFLFQTPADFETGRVLGATLITPPVPARYVTVLSAARTALHLSALRVMAEAVG